MLTPIAGAERVYGVRVTVKWLSRGNLSEVIDILLSANCLSKHLSCLVILLKACGRINSKASSFLYIYSHPDGDVYTYTYAYAK